MSITKKLLEIREMEADPMYQQEIQMADKLNNHIIRMSAIYATSSGSDRNFEPVPAGNHIARCYQMIHIGTVEEVVLGETKRQNKVRLVWELPYETKVFKEENGEQPFSIGKDYTLSMHEKSNLRRDLKGWRGKDFTDEEAARFDITALIGKTCSINVVHKVSKTGKTYAEVASIAPIPKGSTCPDQVNKSLVFGYDPFEQHVFDSLPEWLQTKIKSSEEYARLHAPDLHHSADNVDDDLPF